MLGVAQYDPLTQVLDLNHVRISTDGIILTPISLRLAHPPEFDLMARIAGLRLRDRWAAGTPSPTRPSAGATSASTSLPTSYRVDFGPHIRAELDTIIPIVVGARPIAPSWSGSGERDDRDVGVVKLGG
jgi:hypothetical protein